MNGAGAEYERILKSFHDTEDNQEKKYAVNSLGATNVEALKLRTLDWAVKSGEVKLQDFFYPIGSVASSLAGAELAWKYYREVIANLLLDLFPSLTKIVVSCRISPSSRKKSRNAPLRSWMQSL
jgi:hypothetical protein